MKTFKFTVINSDRWAITNKEIIVVAANKLAATEKLIQSGYEINNDSELIELDEGVHIIQEDITE